jgi:hypothetical protein
MRRKLLLLIAFLAMGPQLAPGESLLEYQVKAVCVLNAARFVSWPSSAFPDAQAPLVIGILGDNPFGSALHDVVNGATVRQRRIIVRRVALSDARECHILFISRSERDRVAAILDALRETNVLTISELDRFVDDGGIIGLALHQGKIRFEVNQEAATRAHLKIDSQFLLLARGAR